MKFFKSQYSLDFEAPIWENDPELFLMDKILENNPDIIMQAAACFPKARDERDAPVGRDGMTLEQIVRCAIYKFHKGLTWRGLSEHTEDSKKGRVFMKMAFGRYFSHQTLQENISKINCEVLEQIHLAVCKHAIELDVENGKSVRSDSTVIETNIHHPTNASLLWDCIRVSCRLLKSVGELFNKVVKFRSYQKVGKKTLFKIVNTKGRDKRLPLFKKMLKYQRACINQVQEAIEKLSSCTFEDAQQEKQRSALLEELNALLPKMEQVLDVAHRREILDEPVPVEEKLFSIFEDHTDCIVKGSRETKFGHKINFTSGKSNMILDCILERGNPADSSFFKPTIENLGSNLDILPKNTACDGGYASKANTAYAQAKGIVNIVFNKVRGTQQNITTSKKMETLLKKWRSGMEAIISNFMRGLKASVCNWKGWEAFQSFVMWGVITFNLRVLARAIFARLTSA